MSMFDQGAVRERPFLSRVKNQPQDEGISEAAFFESVSDDAMLEAIKKAAKVNDRSDAAAACVQWVSGGDADFDELDALLYGLSGGQDDKELNESQEAMYESLLDEAGDFIHQVSNAKDEDIEMMSEDDDAAERVFESLSSAISDVDTDELVAEYSVRDSMMMEATKKVIRDGVLKLVKTKKRRRRMTPAQKAALKKARMKARSGAAKAARKKSMRKRKARGL